MSDPFGPLRYYHCDERVPETIVEHLRDHQWIFMFQSRDKFAMFLANEIEIPRQEVTRLRSLLRQKDMEITRLRAENIHLRRAGMNRPSAELHEAALAELRADNERLRARVEVLERACRLIEADPDPNAVVECVACYRHSRLAYHALEAKP